MSIMLFVNINVFSSQFVPQLADPVGTIVSCIYLHDVAYQSDIAKTAGTMPQASDCRYL